MDLCDATDMTTCFVLASKSPARLRMLRSAGIEPVVIASGADESHLRGEDAVAMTARLSRLKAHSVIESGALEEYPADRMIVVACDSVLNLDGRILGKPHTAERARQWWRRMRGHQGVLVSGHHVAVIVNGQLREDPHRPNRRHICRPHRRRNRRLRGQWGTRRGGGGVHYRRFGRRLYYSYQR